MAYVVAHEIAPDDYFPRRASLWRVYQPLACEQDAVLLLPLIAVFLGDSRLVEWWRRRATGPLRGGNGSLGDGN